MSILAVGVFFIVLAAGVVFYTSIAREVPDPSQLLAKQSQFASTKIYDRNGNLMVELTDVSDPTAGRRQRVDISQISDVLKTATLATEDPNFYRYNVGFDPIAILRMVYYVFTERDVVSGGSTITQQVARMLLLDPEERASRTPMRKLREIVIANEISRLYPRDKILEIYLNEINYGNLAYGIEAASQTYFNKPAVALNLAEASLLAGLPQAPAYWDPVLHKDRALRRQQVVLELMVERGLLSAAQVEPALDATRKADFKPPRVNVSTVAPHFINYVRDQLDAEFGQQLYRDGLRVRTTLDVNIQSIAEKAVRDQIAKLKDKNVTNAATVVIDPRTGEILAMVGSVDFYSDTIKGQVNVALMPRQPGSSIKPFTYLAEMERGATPATMYWDRKTTFTNQYGQTYTPVNYDGTYHGAVLMRESLARSLNVPAVLALNDVGLPAFMTMTQKVGIAFPPNPAYGLAVTLGGAEARLIDMTSAYAVIANGGVRLPSTAIARVERADGTLLRDYLT
ncbi:MAG: transglycosylase domain-containing protein, partial [Thermoflexales bacterium]|nr:transglycosylase domain-containing protein [Thermoflexales bacterium]